MRAILSLVLFVVIAGCGSNEQRGLDFQRNPSDPEWNAQADFANSKLVKYYRDNGVALSCEEICLKLNESQFLLLERFAPQFFAIKDKINRIEIRQYSEVSFSHPVGTYIMFLPWNATSATFDNLFLVFDKILSLEASLSRKFFVSHTSPKYADALDELLRNGLKLKALGIPKFYLTEDSTAFSKELQLAQINVDSVAEHFEATVDRLNLFIKAYSKLSNLDLSILSEDEKNYAFVVEMIGNASKINGVIGHRNFTLLIDVSTEDYFISGRNMIGSALVEVSSTWQMDQLIEVLDYEGYLLDLVKLFKVRVDTIDNLTPYGQAQRCKEKLIILQDAILNKIKQIQSVKIDYAYDGSSYYSKDRILVLNCSHDTAQQMLDLISEIP
jgi:hypothetical protein